MRRLSRLLAVSVLACTDATEPVPPPVEVAILAPSPDEGYYELDPIVLIGEAGASDLGPLPDDSLLWTYGIQALGTGRRVVTRARAGREPILLTARYGPRTTRATLLIDAAPDGLGRLLWTVPLDTNQADALALDPTSGTLYAHDRDGEVAVAVALDGSVRWRSELGIYAQRSPPAVGPDGALFYGYWVGPAGGPNNKPGGVLALNPDGTRRWVFIAAEHGPVGSTYYHSHGGVALDASGNVYLATEENDSPLYGIAPDGSLRWRTATHTTGYLSRFWSYATLLTDSLVGSPRVGDSLPVVGTEAGVQRWSAAMGPSYFCLLAPAVGADGAVYVSKWQDPATFAPGVAAYNPSGTVRWTQPLPVQPRSGSPVVGGDRLYFAAPNGGVLVLTISGLTEATWGPPLAAYFHDGITLAGKDVLYVAANDTLLSYDRAGTRRFAVPIPHRVSSGCYEAQGGPVVGRDGTIYVRASDGGVMAFRDTVGPATSAPWPTLQGDFTRRGRRATDGASGPAALTEATGHVLSAPRAPALHFGRHAPPPLLPRTADGLDSSPHRPAGRVPRPHR